MEPEKPERRAPDDDALSQRLDSLRDRLDKSGRAKVEKSQHEASSSDRAGIAQAFKLSSEFIAGIVVGGLVGYAIDWYFGTSPWGLIVFLLLGFGAAILNVLRASGMVAESALRMHKGAGSQDDTIDRP